MTPRLLFLFLLVGASIAAPMCIHADPGNPGTPVERDFSPPPDERQLPRAMHSHMAVRPRIVVGQRDGDLVGRDNRVLQAAVDYLAGLGGGTVEIGEGVYDMFDSLHLRPRVNVRGVSGRTILRKAKAAVSALALDGDFGEEQITVTDPEGFGVGRGVAIWDSRSGGFHTTVGRITGANGNTFSIDKPLNADCMVANDARAATVFPVVSGYNLEGVRVEGLVIDGNKEENPHLNGCRGAGIFLYRFNDLFKRFIRRIRPNGKCINIAA